MANILAIDNDAVLLDLVATSLRLDGHNVTALTDSESALHFCLSGRSNIDLVVTDITTTPISGFHLAKHLAEHHLSVPVLFMSEVPAMLGVVVDTLGHRFALEKPFTSSLLRYFVKRLLSRVSAKQSHN
jgi:DNA-binding NtrC family response regulator